MSIGNSLDPERFVRDLERKIRSQVLAQLPADPSGELAAKDLGSLLMTYGNWRSRHVRPRPRTAHLSAELRRSTKLAEHQTVVDRIVAAIEAGDDLRPHLSRRIATAYVPMGQRAPNLPGRPDLDLLISDWGLHHLHLTTEVCSDGFYRRTGDLLFAKFTDDDAFLIAILGHGNWAEKNLLEVLVRNWSGADTGMAEMSGLSLVNTPTNNDHLQARNAALLQPVEIDGSLYFPPGMTTAGTPIDVTSRVHALIRLLQSWRTDLPDVLAQVEAQFDTDMRGLAGDGPWESYVDEDDTLGLRKGQIHVPVTALW